GPRSATGASGYDACPMSSPQGGIFALGTASHAYLEFDRVGGCAPADLGRAIASPPEPRETMGGGNVVAGSGPSSGHRSCPTTPRPVSPDSTRTSSAPRGS